MVDLAYMMHGSRRSSSLDLLFLLQSNHLDANRSRDHGGVDGENLANIAVHIRGVHPDHSDGERLRAAAASLHSEGSIGRS